MSYEGDTRNFDDYPETDWRQVDIKIHCTYENPFVEVMCINISNWMKNCGKKDKRRERSPLVLCINHQQQIINISYTLGPWMNCLRSPKNSQTISKLEETKQNYNLVIFRCQASQRENSGCLTTFSPEVWDSENDRESKILTPTLDQETRLLKSGLSTVSWTISGSLHLWYINFKIQVLSWPDFYYQGFFGLL